VKGLKQSLRERGMIEIKVCDFIDTLVPIASELGVELVLELVKHFGGCRLYIPQRWNRALDINVVGDDMAQRLCQLFGPERIDIPIMAYKPCALQRFAVLLREDGYDNNQIAVQLGMSYRTVMRYIHHAPLTKDKKIAFDDKQMDIENYIARTK
jgi:hypothetical protein